ncbi:MAG: hypothetical protein MZU95_17650 [Desulfomicrobium escambiense]|nr:hypothetical protein [Desulfomicrobium escambiense]
MTERRDIAPVLEEAKRLGLLKLRPIHGDPKVDNVMIDDETGRAVGMVGLRHRQARSCSV